MNNIYDDIASTIAKTLTDCVAIDVVYQRGAQTIPIKASRAGNSWNVQQRETGGGVELSDRDYIIQAADLPFTPIDKDKIIDAGQTWKVLGVGAEKCWRYCDPNQRLIRIHTKRDS